MKLISYKSNLAPFQYDELLNLIKAGVVSGEFAASSVFDSASITQLQQDARDFSKLAVDTAGHRVSEDSLNRPINLLQARYSALSSEAGDFSTRADKLLSVVDKDEALIDQLLAAANLQSWAYLQTPLSGAVPTKWDYGMGYGSIASTTDIVLTNPANSVTYAARPPLYTILDVADGTIHAGIVPPVSVFPVVPKGLTWSFSVADAQSSQDVGTNWAGLSLLAPSPLINFTQDPAVNVQLPIGGSISDSFEVSGVVPGGSVPISVRILFVPRRNSAVISVFDATLGSLATAMTVKPLDNVYIEATIAAAAGTNGVMKAELALFKGDGTAVLNADGTTKTVPLPPVSPNTAGIFTSGIVVIPNQPEVKQAKLQFTAVGTTIGSWSQPSFRVHLPNYVATSVTPDDVSVYVTGGKVYFPTDDFLADDSGQVTLQNVPDGSTLNVLYSELYPAYQCSVDGSTWSPEVMLDPLRPYPDSATLFVPVPLALDSAGNLTRFPLTDELGNATGLYLRMKQAPLNEYLFTVSTPATGVIPGVTSVLEIEFERPAYLTHLLLSPFTTFPCRISQIESQAFTTDTRAVLFSKGAGDGPLLDRALRVRFPRTLVRRIFLTLYQENYESNEYTQDPPDQLRREALSSLQSTLPDILRRAQQAVPEVIRGAQYDFGAEDIVGEDWTFQTPAVIVAGPYRLTGAPEVLRFDSNQRGSPAYYLCYRAWDASGNPIDSNSSGVALSSNSCVAFPWAAGANLSLIAKTDIYLKIVLTTASDIVERFMFQTTKV